MQQLKVNLIPYFPENIIYLHGYNPSDDFGSISPLQASLDSADIEIEDRNN